MATTSRSSAAPVCPIRGESHVVLCVDRDRVTVVEVALVSEPTEWLLVTNVPFFFSVSQALQYLQPLTQEGISGCHVAVPFESPSSYCLLLHVDRRETAVELRKKVHSKTVSPLAKEPLFTDYLAGELVVRRAPGSDHPGRLAGVLPGTRMDLYALCSPRAAVVAAAAGASLSLPSTPVPFTPPAAGGHPLLAPLPLALAGEPAASPTALEAGGVAAFRVSGGRGVEWTGPRGLRASGTAARGEECAICQVDALSDLPCVRTLCDHEFHLRCFAQLEDNFCPLCRFDMSVMGSSWACEACGSHEDLWVCLICGYMGCGRRRNHQQWHVDATGHTHSMQVGGYRVWNYARNTFVHRELAEEIGEVDVSAADDGSGDVYGNDRRGAKLGLGHWDPHSWSRVEDDHDEELQGVIFQSKQEAIQRYFTALLHHLMAEQGRYFEGMLRGDHQAAMLETPRAAPEASGAFALIAEEECSARRAVVRMYVSSLKRIAATERIELHSAVAALRHQRAKVQEDVDLLAATNHSLLAGIEKLEVLMAKKGDGTAPASATLREKRATREQLERRLAGLLTQLTGEST